MGTEPESAFREHASGLLVPAEQSRAREAWTKDEGKTLSRAIQKVLGPHAIKFILICDHKGCRDPRIQRLKQPGGGFILRCGHADRVVSEAW